MWELLVIFGGVVGIIGVTGYFKAVREGALGPRAASQNKELEALRDERRLLEARVQNLESVVCSVDLELNARLARLAREQSAIRALPSGTTPSPQPALATGGGSVAVATGPTLAVSRRGVLATMAQLELGQKIAGRYTIQRELGHGGMGVVYLATDEKLGERVALKVVLSTGADDPEAAAERFRREVASARKVTNPHVIRIHDLVEDGPYLLLSMEFVDGMTLGNYLTRTGVLPIAEARHLLGQVCEGMAAAHAVGVIHRDLKPGNVLLDERKQVKVIDFGLAKASYLANMTATGLILGTPEYMSPEQVQGLPCDARTDVYAIGVIAYQLLTGRPPFVGENPIEVGFKHVRDPVRPPRQLRPEVPEALEAAVLKALEKDPDRRFLDGAELRRALAS